ncbi:hypothetical protein D9V41_00335 [Aeromicrobium phragmitis]|uniref:Uncharacterized protein n=1 Tax=Aeromicrobium phragmitis TaxID=2478914 RepID=A0A3L8PNZ8_9ACTN|nr:hypothetical protein [Aeromicrobium phragmitis]RLV57145.1 hypothetical protein D9V41_00335 [Aeromicrobium phragmitis]
MKFADFAAHYRRDAPAAPRMPADHRSLLMPAYRAAVERGKLLHDVLAHDAVLPHAEVSRRLTHYNAWTVAGYGGIVDRITQIGEETGDELHESAGPLWQYRHWHGMCGAFGNEWAQVLTGDLRMDGYHPDKTRLNLGTGGLDYYLRRGKPGVDYFAEDERPLLVGMHTEIDAGIALLELTARHRSLLVLPAPPQFEMFAGRCNVDFLVLDMKRRQVRGVQVKSMRHAQDLDRYDPAVVTIITGEWDLDNVRAVRRHARTSDMDVVPWPGLITTHFLGSTRLSANPPRLDATQVQRVKSRARTLSADARDRNREVFERVVTKVLADLRR